MIAAIEAVCRAKGIKDGSFSAAGSVVSAAIGVYDAEQQVFVTHVEKDSTEILSCAGSISQKEGACRIGATIVLANSRGILTGGHLFSATTAAGADILVQELLNGI